MRICCQKHLHAHDHSQGGTTVRVSNVRIGFQAQQTPHGAHVGARTNRKVSVRPVLETLQNRLQFESASEKSRNGKTVRVSVLYENVHHQTVEKSSRKKSHKKND